MRSIHLCLAAAGIVIMSQAVVRPPANLVSLRDGSAGILQRLWPRTGDPLRLRGDGAGWPGDRGECGFTMDPALAVPRVIDAAHAVEQVAQNIYRGDLVEAVVDKTPGWRIRLWQLWYGLGFWSGRLDEESGPASPAEVERARRFALRWYSDRVLQLTCDAARAVRSKDLSAARLS